MLFLDTETTGLATPDQIIEIAIVDQTGKGLLNTLVNPGRVPINGHAQAAHGITATMLTPPERGKSAAAPARGPTATG